MLTFRDVVWIVGVFYRNKYTQKFENTHRIFQETFGQTHTELFNSHSANLANCQKQDCVLNPLTI